ncbi:MAG TPA: hypothetical protein VFE65_04770 [Pseudonocardia sp.]|nr:hypothetical protein [Pseudonocardia sp.]
MVSGASGGPAVRYLVGAVLVAVLIGDGLMIVGYTTQVRGRALSALEAGASGSEPGVGAPVPLSPPLLPEGPPVAQTPSVARPPAGPAPSRPGSRPSENTVPAAPVDPPDVAAKPEASPPSSPGTRQGPDPRWPDSRWPDSLPDPDAVARGGHGNSPFTQRCASGDISARWCQGFPGERK